MTITILGKRWRLEFCRMPKHKGVQQYGECDDPKSSDKAIRIHQRLSDPEMLDTIIHECLHAAGWHLDHDYVDAFASDLARILTRLGYHR